MSVVIWDNTRGGWYDKCGNKGDSVKHPKKKIGKWLRKTMNTVKNHIYKY